jgi:hypothetical protein
MESGCPVDFSLCAPIGVIDQRCPFRHARLAQDPSESGPGQSRSRIAGLGGGLAKAALLAALGQKQAAPCDLPLGINNVPARGVLVEGTITQCAGVEPLRDQNLIGFHINRGRSYGLTFTVLLLSAGCAGVTVLGVPAVRR